MQDQPEGLIEISNLRFSYPNLDVLKGLDLSVPRGKVVAILGASGCGKTTLLRLIGGQLRPAAGHVKVEGQVIHELGTDALYEMRRKMGMMFQQGGLMKLHSVGLRGAHPLMPSELSGGMSRRVALSRAIALDPMLIMYDEPFSGLDPISLTQIGNLIRGLNDALGVTSIVVTYDVAESLKVVDYAYFISDGRIVAQGTPDEIRASTDPFVRQFVDGLADGPVAFHMPGRPLAADLAL
ncbi:MAG: ATP-binding cassette domain-containing protein [Rhodocyclaceae bacterium]|nr:ATP-binding cassette domain-containing protein [Rhodocyclaceae bacterium]